MVRGDNNIIEMYSSMFGCKIGLLRMLYLGMPELFETVGMWIWSLLMQGLLKKLDACQGNAVVVD
jgi:hypothetical protein